MIVSNQIPHIYRNRFLRESGGGTIISSSSGTSEIAQYAANAGYADLAGLANLANEAKKLTDDSTDWAKIARKDIAQSILAAWTFTEGFTSTKKAYFNSGIEVTGQTKTGTLLSTGNAEVQGTLSVTGNISTSASISASNDVTANAMSATTSIEAATMIANALYKTQGYAAMQGMMGHGFGVTNNNGIATLQTDNLYVLGRMFVNTLNIREVNYIGGIYILTPAASVAYKVQPLYRPESAAPSFDTKAWTTDDSYAAGGIVGYRILCSRDDGTVGTMNYWQQGDIAYCQTFNIEPGQHTNVSNQYYKRLVCRTGDVDLTENGETKKFHYIDLANTYDVLLYKIIGYDEHGNPIYQQLIPKNRHSSDPMLYNAFEGIPNPSNNTEPKTDDKIVCLGAESIVENKGTPQETIINSGRQGCIQISAGDGTTQNGEASIGIYDGICNFDPVDTYEIHYMSKTNVRMRADKFWWRSSGGTLTHSQAGFEVKIGNAGIDINNEIIKLKANRVNFYDSDGINLNSKIWIDPTTGTLNAVDGNFEGTVKAKNLFKTLAVSGGGNLTNSCEVVTMMDTNTNVTWVYVLNNIPESDYGHAFTEGQMLTGQEINAMVDSNSRFCWKSDTTNFRIFTGPADELILVNKVSSAYSGYTFIPRCQDFPGKEITIRNYTSNQAAAEIRQVDNASQKFAAGAYVSSPSDDYNDIGYGSNLENHTSVAQGDVITLYSTGSVWLKLN